MSMIEPRREELRQLYLELRTLDNVAKHYGHNRSWVTIWMDVYGIPHRSWHHALTDEEVGGEWEESGHQVKRMAENLKLTPRSVRWLLRRAGLKSGAKYVSETVRGCRAAQRAMQAVALWPSLDSWEGSMK